MHIWKLLVSLDIDIIIIFELTLCHPQRRYTCLPKKNQKVSWSKARLKPNISPTVEKKVETSSSSGG